MNGDCSARTVVPRPTFFFTTASLLFSTFLLSALAQTASAQTAPDAAPVQPAAEQPSAEEPKTPASVFMDILSKRARGLARQEFVPHPRDLPEALDNMNYQQYRLINFRPEAALWKGESLFEVQFFHPGFLYKEPVSVRVLDRDGTNTRFAFSPELFLYPN